jgi:RHS repeat-associated protein
MSMVRPGGGSMGDSGDPYDGYDRFGRVQEMRWQSSSTGTPIDAWQWGYNEASNRTWKKNLVATPGQDEAYGYDGLYQVIRDAVGTLNTNRTAIGGVPAEEEDFTYDPTGNWLGYRKEANGSVVLDQSRSNNKDNQLTQIDGSSALLSYDRAGNATKVPPGTGTDWTKYYQPVWDAWNRIVEVKDENGSSVQKNAYDGLARRITREVASVVTHTYWSDRWKPLEERIGSSTSAARSYLWGERPGHRDELILRDRDTDGNGTLDERLYATMDYFNGTAVLNTSGAVQERYAYSAFGVRRIMEADFLPRTASDFDWDFGFQGQFRDADTGWSNYGFRYYVPELGRWINRDPIGERGGMNLYNFSTNNPINFNDILGLQGGGVEVVQSLPDPLSLKPLFLETGKSETRYTNRKFECKCDCKTPGEWKIICQVGFDASIYLSKAQAIALGVNLENLYGPEQQHVAQKKGAVESIIADAKAKEGGPFSDFDKCSDSLRAWNGQLKERFNKIWIENPHDPKPNNPDDPRPASEEQFPPLEGSHYGGMINELAGWGGF